MKYNKKCQQPFFGGKYWEWKWSTNMNEKTPMNQYIIKMIMKANTRKFLWNVWNVGTRDIIIQCSKLCLDYGLGNLAIYATIHLLLCDVDGVANFEVDWADTQHQKRKHRLVAMDFGKDFKKCILCIKWYKPPCKKTHNVEHPRHHNLLGLNNTLWVF
jgi:hypothetical protein